jgi:hypothetical protein
MRPELLCPEKITSEAVADALALVGSQVDRGALGRWVHLEKVLAYDWAMREHLRASDGLIGRRDKPSFVTAAELPPEPIGLGSHSIVLPAARVPSQAGIQPDQQGPAGEHDGPGDDAQHGANQP